MADERVWGEHRYGIVAASNVAKFGQHADLRAFLLAAGQRVLVGASPVDRLWGIGLAADDERAGELNLLGFALMQARTILQRADA